MSIEGKVALVTGATRGIGRAIALQLAKQGATVIGTATSAGGAEKISAALAEVGNGGTGIVMDVSAQESVDAGLAGIVEQFGAPTIVVNNAGIARDNIMLRMKSDEWDEVINTNLTSMYRVTKASIKGMTKARWGRIINISSVVGSMGNPGQANYAAAKAGLEGFGRALASEIGSRGITVNAVAPGFIETDMTEGLAGRSQGCVAAKSAGGTFGATGRNRCCSWLSGQRRSRLHIGYHAACQRWYVYVKLPLLVIRDVFLIPFRYCTEGKVSIRCPLVFGGKMNRVKASLKNRWFILHYWVISNIIRSHVSCNLYNNP